MEQEDKTTATKKIKGENRRYTVCTVWEGINKTGFSHMIIYTEYLKKMT